jgi:hypothetical protein
MGIVILRANRSLSLFHRQMAPLSGPCVLDVHDLDGLRRYKGCSAESIVLAGVTEQLIKEFV